MGAINFSIDGEFVKYLKNLLPLKIFVETGTFKGETVLLVQDLFDDIYTVELSGEYFAAASSLFADRNHVHVYNENSPVVLRSLAPSIRPESVLYWLDAHWCVADYTSGETSQCPLLEELTAIGSINQETIIMIDDARYFLCPPPYPHEISQWPGLSEIILQLGQLSSKHKIVVFNDVIVFYPQLIDSGIKAYMHQHAVDWLQVSYKAAHYDDMHQAAQERLTLIQQLDQACKDKEAIIQYQHAQLLKKQ